MINCASRNDFFVASCLRVKYFDLVFSLPAYQVTA